MLWPQSRNRACSASCLFISCLAGRDQRQLLNTKPARTNRARRPGRLRHLMDDDPFPYVGNGPNQTGKRLSAKSGFSIRPDVPPRLRGLSPGDEPRDAHGRDDHGRDSSAGPRPLPDQIQSRQRDLGYPGGPHPSWSGDISQPSIAPRSLSVNRYDVIAEALSCTTIRAVGGSKPRR